MPSNQSNSENAKFNMRISVGRTSFVDNIEAESKALHESIEIKCFYEGNTTLLVGSKTVTASAGDIVVINPYEFHATVDCGDGSGKYHLFMIPLDFFSADGVDALKLRLLLLANNKSFKTLFRNDTRMLRILMRAAKEYEEKKTAYTVAIRGLMMEFFAILMRKGIRDDGKTDIQKDNLRSYRLIEPALRHIRDNYADCFTINDLAALCNLSKHYFCRVFKTVTGTTAMEYLKDYRMKISDAMLSNTDKSITQISNQCGFESVSYFCRCYKGRYGISPSKRRATKQ